MDSHDASSAFIKKWEWKRFTCGTFFSFDPFKVSGPRLRRSGPRDGQVRVPQERVRLPPGCQEAEGRLPERHPVHVEVWQDGGHVVPDSRLRRLGSRQRQLPDTSQVGSPGTGPPSAPPARTAALSSICRQAATQIAVPLPVVQSVRVSAGHVGHEESQALRGGNAHDKAAAFQQR